MNAHRPTFAFCLSLGLSLGLGLPLTSLAADAPSSPRFEPVSCPTEVTGAECGFVTVPENRALKLPDASRGADPERLVRLFVMRVKPKGMSVGQEPLFILSGGPGERATPYLQMSSLFEDRELVIFDQRGNGYSQPALECPELFRGGYGELAIEDVGEHEYQALFSCGRRFRARGIDLKAYNATNSAADIDSVRMALGYERINLLGISYGTRLAQEYMRGYSAHLRSVVLDSVVPPSIDRSADMPRTAENALLKVFAACAESADCNQDYPDLTMRWLELVGHLDETTGESDAESLPMKVHHLLSHIFNRLYSPYFLSSLPALVYELHTGDMPSRAAQAPDKPLPADDPSPIAWGSFFAVECQGEIANSSPAALEKTFAALPYWRKAMAPLPGISSPRIYELCQAWGLTEPSGQENEPVATDVPTLLLAGSFDPVTPPEYLAQAIQKMTHAYPFEFPLAHSLIRTSSCATAMVQDFLNHPESAPDASCIKAEDAF